MSTRLTIEVDGEFVALRGTTKGDAAQRAAIHRPWVWGGRAGAWVLPRNLRPETRAQAIRTVTAALEAAGYEVDGEDTGVRQTEAERRSASMERLEHRADRYEASATRLAAEAASRDAAEHALLDPIPFGQPNIGGRLTPVLKRAEQHRVAASKAHSGAERLASLAEGIRRELAGTPLVTLQRRIERNEAEVRRFTRLINGTDPSQDTYTATGERLERLTEMRQRAQEAIDLDRTELERRTEEDGVRVWTRADFVKGDEVASTFGWSPVLRVNAKSVTIPHIHERLAEAGHIWTLPYAEVRARRRGGEVTLTLPVAKPSEAASLPTKES